MTVGIIGAGAIGSNIARLFAKSGIAATIANATPCRMEGLPPEDGILPQTAPCGNAHVAHTVLIVIGTWQSVDSRSMRAAEAGMRGFVRSIVAGSLLFWASAALAQNAAGDGKPRIFVADRDGNNVKLLVEIPDAAYHGSPHWSSDGRMILLDRTFPVAEQIALVIGPLIDRRNPAGGLTRRCNCAHRSIPPACQERQHGYFARQQPETN